MQSIEQRQAKLTSKGPCNCGLCQRSRRFYRNTETIPEAEREWMRDIYDVLIEFETVAEMEEAARRTSAPACEHSPTSFFMLSVVIAIVASVFALAITESLWPFLQICFVFQLIGFGLMAIIRRIYQSDARRFDEQMNNLTSAQETSNIPKEGVR